MSTATTLQSPTERFVRLMVRSEKQILTLTPKTQIWARAFLQTLHDAGIAMAITSGTRTYAEQTALYAKGRTAGGAKVTNAKAGYSNHNFGIALDLTLFTEGGVPTWDSPLYKTAGVIGRDMGLVWGGDWRGFKDEPHFEVPRKIGAQPGMAILRTLYRTGLAKGAPMHAIDTLIRDYGILARAAKA